MPKEVIAIDPNLANNLRIAKEKLDQAKAEVEAAESAIYLAVKDKIPEKGVTHVTGCKITTKFYEKWDQAKISNIETTWPRKSNLPFPFKKEWKADAKAITYLRENAKDAYDALSEALTLTPAKPAFELVEEKK